LPVLDSFVRVRRRRPLAPPLARRAAAYSFRS